MTDLRLMPSRMPAVADGVDVLAGALAHVAVVVEEDGLLVTGLVALDLRQDRVEVLP
jgi:hypothetical protein